MILGARALGLDCGPMSGFDNAKLDEEFFAAGKCESCEQEFFPEGHVKSNFLCNIGYGALRSLCRGALGSTLAKHAPCCDCRLLSSNTQRHSNSSTHALDGLLVNSCVVTELELFKSRDVKGTIRSDVRLPFVSNDVRRHRLISISDISLLPFHAGGRGFESRRPRHFQFLSSVTSRGEAFALALKRWTKVNEAGVVPFSPLTQSPRTRRRLRASVIALDLGTHSG